MSGHPDLTADGWRTSSRTANGSECVEVAVTVTVRNR